MKILLSFLLMLFCQALTAQNVPLSPADDCSEIDEQVCIPVERPCCMQYDDQTGQIVKKDIQECLIDWITTHFVYPKKALEEGKGRVQILFKVDAMGKVSINKIMGGTPVLRQAAGQIFYNFPEITPAKNLYGKNISVQFHLPITFSGEEK